MRSGLVPAPEALELILRDAKPSTSEQVKLSESCGRVLSNDVKALRTQPPFDASAMDGYAVRQCDLGALPASLKIIGQSAAGHPFAGEIQQGEAVRIFTGAPLPGNADTIIIQENTRANGSNVEILEGNSKGKFIRKAGLDFGEGDILLEQGRVMDPQSLSLAAAMNHAKLNVWKKPLVAIMATGDELVPPGSPLNEGQIIASNGYALGTMAQNAGATIIDLGIAKDTADALVRATQKAIAQGVDLIITMGGASVGDHDLVLPAMESQGFDFQFAKIAMRPGKPFLFATNKVNGKTIRLLGLAGNPVSSIVAGHIFVRPLINQLAGLPPQLANPVPAILGAALPANDERQEYMRATITLNETAERIVYPFRSQDSSQLANLVRADCLLLREIDAPAAHIGDECRVVLLRGAQGSFSDK